MVLNHTSTMLQTTNLIRARGKMIDNLKKFERIVTGALLVMLVVVVALALIELAWIIVQDVMKPPVFILEIRDLLEIFGFFSPGAHRPRTVGDH